MIPKIKTEFSTVDTYLSHQQPPHRETLEELRKLIRSVVPEAEEMISYQVFCFKVHGMLVGIGAGKDHCSFYTMSPGLVRI